MPARKNLVHETTTGTGTGNLTLAAVNGKKPFKEFGTGATPDVFDYFISDRDSPDYERGTGHMSNDTTLVRDTVIESTNADAAVNFGAGTKDVTNDVPALEQDDAALKSANLSDLDDTDTGRTNITAEELGVSRGINAQTGTAYTLVIGDAGQTVTLNNASAITLTIPTNASVAFATATYINLHQLGAGQVTVGGAGVTIRSANGTKLSAQYSTATLQKIATDTWLLAGDLTT